MSNWNKKHAHLTHITVWWNKKSLIFTFSNFKIQDRSVGVEFALLSDISVPDSSVLPSTSQGESAGWLTQWWICLFAFDHCGFNRHHMGSCACLAFNNLGKNGSSYVIESVLDWQVGIKMGGGRSIRVCEHIFLWANFCSSDILCPLAVFFFYFLTFDFPCSSHILSIVFSLSCVTKMADVPLTWYSQDTN